MSAGVLKHTIIRRHPETMVATALLQGEPVPDWATDLVHEDNPESAKASKEKAEAEADAGAPSPEDDAPAAKKTAAKKTAASK